MSSAPLHGFLISRRKLSMGSCEAETSHAKPCQCQNSCLKNNEKKNNDKMQNHPNLEMNSGSVPCLPKRQTCFFWPVATPRFTKGAGRGRLRQAGLARGPLRRRDQRDDRGADDVAGGGLCHHLGHPVSVERWQWRILRPFF